MRNWLIAIIFFVLGILTAAAFYSGQDVAGLDSAPANESTAMESNTENSEPEVVYLDSYESQAMEASVPIAAVDQRHGRGVIGTATVKVIPGSGNVLVKTDPFLETDLQHSSNVAAAVAERITGEMLSDKDLVYSYDISSMLVAGDSAGAATTVATVAALEGRKIKDNVVMTGTIKSDGSVGQIGGLLDKAMAAKEAGYDTMLIPQGQDTVEYYDTIISQNENGSESSKSYVPRVTKLSDHVPGLRIIEVGTIDEALGYMFEDGNTGTD